MENCPWDTLLSYLKNYSGWSLANMLITLILPETIDLIGYILSILCMPISIVLGMVSCQSWQKSPKMLKKTRFVGSRLFKVIVFGTNQKGICDFLLAVNSNLLSILHSFGATVAYWSKCRLWDQPSSPLMPSSSVIPCECVAEPYIAKTRVIWLPDSKEGIILYSFFLTQY